MKPAGMKQDEIIWRSVGRGNGKNRRYEAVVVGDCWAEIYPASTGWWLEVIAGDAEERPGEFHAFISDIRADEPAARSEAEKWICVFREGR